MAAFGNEAHARGYQQFEAIALPARSRRQTSHARRCRTRSAGSHFRHLVARSVLLQPRQEHRLVGKISPSGFFTPAVDYPHANFDVWVVATLPGEKERPLVGKSYMVVTVPTYTSNGRRYVRDLDRWVDDGPAQ